MIRKYLLIFILLHISFFTFSQVKIGKNSSVINKSSILELESNNQGLLLPRINDTLLINSLNPPDGMLLFLIDSLNQQNLIIRKNGYWKFLQTNLIDSLNSINFPKTTGILKSIGSNILSIAVPGVDYQYPFILTTTGNVGSSSYSPTTGILNIPNYTLTGLGGEPTISTGSNLQYWRGDKTWQTLNTSVVPELTNLYYTDTRSRNALSFASGVGSYSSTTGIITIPTSTSDLTNGANYITLGSLTGGTGISYNSNTGVISSTITQYTDANARSSISLTTTGNAGSSSYSPTTGILNIPNYTLTGLGGEPTISTGSNLQYWRGDKTWQTLNTSVVPELTNLYYTDTRSRNALSFASGVGSYSSTTGIITIPTSTSDLTNGANYITLGSLSGTAPISYNNSTGAFSISQASTTTNGYLSSTDWNTFNNKQESLTLTTTGTSGAATLTGNTLNIPLYSGGSFYTFSSPLVNISGTVSIPISSSSTSGYLSSANWTTFNNKQNALTNPVTATGTVTSGYLPKWTGTNVIENSIIYDNGNNVAIGKTSPNANLDIYQSSTNRKGLWITGAEYYQPQYGNDASNGIAIVLGVNRGGNRQVWIGSSEVIGSSTLGVLRFQTGTKIPNIDATSGDGGSRLNLGLGTSSTNVLIGTPEGNSTLPGSSLSVSRNLAVGSSYWPLAAPLNGAIFEGSVGIGTSSPSSLLSLGSPGGLTGIMSMSGKSNGTVKIQPQDATDNYTLTLPNTAGTSGQQLTTDGIGNLTWTSNTLPLTGGTMSGTLNFFKTSNYNAITFFSGVTQTKAGSIDVSGNSVSFTQTSDYRLKQDFRQFNALALIDSMKVYDYQWKSDKSRSYGVKAHELQKVIPYVVQGEKDAVNEDGSIKPQGVDYSKLIPVLVKAIQELRIQNENLNFQIIDLKKQIEKKIEQFFFYEIFHEKQ